VRVGWPEALPQFLAGHDLARLFEERYKDLVHLSLKFEPEAILGYFLPLLINLKRTKTREPRA
jgi:hypothetical protein